MIAEPREEPVLIAPDMLAPGASVRRDFERGMRAVPPLTIALLLANALVFAWELARGALASEESIVAAGALVRARVLAGEPWRLVTAPFLHGGPDHLIGNLVALYVVGMACEHALGPARAALIYGVSAVVGSGLSTLLSPGPSVGASGAVFGVLAAVVVVLYKHQDRFFVRDKRIGFVLLAWGIYQVTIGFLTPFVDNFAHIGGALGGAGVALACEPRLSRPMHGR
ncbi:MAG: rhomboid family intramembrane serine protease [Gemmatimonadales bacterium]